MGRSSRAQANENRARVVEVAMARFLAEGVDAVGIAEIMKAAGMTQGAFYRHFASKDDLAVEACKLSFAVAVKVWNEVAERATQKEQKLIDELISFYLTARPPEMTCPMIAFARDVSNRAPGDALRSAYEAGVQDLFDTFTEISSKEGTKRGSDELRLLFSGMIGSSLITRFAHVDGLLGLVPAVISAAGVNKT